MSRTAIGCAVLRAWHRIRHARPWVLDDPYAEPLARPRWAAVGRDLETSLPAERINQMISAMVVRSRYTEDRLRSGAFSQYVLLGAGLDSVALRGTGTDRPVRILEIDDAATQAWKRERIDDLALPLPAGHAFVPVDFETEDFRNGLDDAGIDWTSPTLVSWLGVTQYLTRDAIERTLRALSAFGPGSEIVFTYQALEHARTPSGEDNDVAAHAATRGERFVTPLDHDDAARLTADCGLRVLEHLTHDDMRERYLRGRPDRLSPPPVQRTIAAAVADRTAPSPARRA